MAGSGPELPRIQSLVKDLDARNITLLDHQSQDELIRLLQKTKAFVFDACENFGILPVEAMACGTPVIDYGRGGVLDTVQGLLDPNPPAILISRPDSRVDDRSSRTFERESSRIRPETCRSWRKN